MCKTRSSGNVSTKVNILQKVCHAIGHVNRAVPLAGFCTVMYNYSIIEGVDRKVNTSSSKDGVNQMKQVYVSVHFLII